MDKHLLNNHGNLDLPRPFESSSLQEHLIRVFCIWFLDSKQHCIWFLLCWLFHFISSSSFRNILHWLMISLVILVYIKEAIKPTCLLFWEVESDAWFLESKLYWWLSWLNSTYKAEVLSPPHKPTYQLKLSVTHQSVTHRTQEAWDMLLANLLVSLIINPPGAAGMTQVCTTDPVESCFKFGKQYPLGEPLSPIVRKC